MESKPRYSMHKGEVQIHVRTRNSLKHWETLKFYITNHIKYFMGTRSDELHGQWLEKFISAHGICHKHSQIICLTYEPVSICWPYPYPFLWTYFFVNSQTLLSSIFLFTFETLQLEWCFRNEIPVKLYKWFSNLTIKKRTFEHVCECNFCNTLQMVLRLDFTAKHFIHVNESYLSAIRNLFTFNVWDC